MTKTKTEPTPVLSAAACEIAAAYVSNNHVAPADLPALVASIHASVATWASRTTAQELAVEPEAGPKPTPAQIRKSITPDALVSFIDSKSYKTLKRHLTKHGFTPDSYRERFGLPVDYPMVATSYAQRRSVLARQLGLGGGMGRGTKH